MQDVPHSNRVETEYSLKDLERLLYPDTDALLEREAQSRTNYTFTAFRHLPPELRRKIWLLTLPEPRILSLHIHETYTTDDSCNMRFYRRTLTSVFFTYSIISNLEPSAYGLDSYQRDKAHPPTAALPSAPVLLHVCHESRLIGMEIYTLAFAGHYLDHSCYLSTFIEKWNKNPLGRKRVWIDFKRDLLFIDLLSKPHYNAPLHLFFPILAEFCPEDISRVQRLAIGCGSSPMIYNRMVANFKATSALKPFEALRELVICDAYEKRFTWPRKEESVVKSISDSLLNIQKSEGWKRELPIIKVSRELDAMERMAIASLGLMD
ncbi:hypothetical protein B0J14DRAFT_604543 [Halenospora varia]|nr:hypothetical protein B0J14DRAFT_604543 [Halenospora varia]